MQDLTLPEKLWKSSGSYWNSPSTLQSRYGPVIFFFLGDLKLTWRECGLRITHDLICSEMGMHSSKKLLGKAGAVSVRCCRFAQPPIFACLNDFLLITILKISYFWQKSADLQRVARIPRCISIPTRVDQNTALFSCVRMLLSMSESHFRTVHYVAISQQLWKS